MAMTTPSCLKKTLLLALPISGAAFWCRPNKEAVVNEVLLGVMFKVMSGFDASARDAEFLAGDVSIGLLEIDVTCCGVSPLTSAFSFASLDAVLEAVVRFVVERNDDLKSSASFWEETGETPEILTVIPLVLPFSK